MSAMGIFRQLYREYLRTALSTLLQDHRIAVDAVAKRADAYALLESSTARSSKPTYRWQVSITGTAFPPSMK
jgi:hypothetical protein